MWFETNNGNRILKKAQISGANHISINEKSTINENVVLRGDVPLLKPEGQVTIDLGRFCYLDTGSQIIPPLIKNDLHGPIKVGSYTIIGKNTKISCASIGSRVLIEDNCHIHDLVIIYECCLIREGTTIPPKTVVPPFSEVSGNPGNNFVITSLPSAYKKIIENEAKRLHLLG